MFFVAREVDGAPEDVEDAAVDHGPVLDTEPLVQPFRIGATEVLHLADAQAVQILGDTGPDTWDGLEVNGS